jgi:hypothetical protein
MVLNSVDDVFTNGEVVESVIPDAVFYQIDNPGESPSPAPGPVDGGKSGSSLPVTISVVILVVVAIFVGSFFAYRRYRKKKARLVDITEAHHVSFDDIQGGMEKFDSLPLIPETEPLGSRYSGSEQETEPSIESYQEPYEHAALLGDEPQDPSASLEGSVFKPSNAESQRPEVLPVVFPMRESKKADGDKDSKPYFDGGSDMDEEIVTTYEDAIESSADIAISGEEAMAAGTVQDSAVELLKDNQPEIQKLVFTPQGISGDIDPATAQSVSSEITDHQTYDGGAFTRFEDVMSVPTQFGDISALRAKTFAELSRLAVFISDKALLSTVIFIPVLQKVFLRELEHSLLGLTRHERADMSRALIPYEGSDDDFTRTSELLRPFTEGPNIAAFYDEDFRDIDVDSYGVMGEPDIKDRDYDIALKSHNASDMMHRDDGSDKREEDAHFIVRPVADGEAREDDERDRKDEGVHTDDEFSRKEEDAAFASTPIVDGEESGEAVFEVGSHVVDKHDFQIPENDGEGSMLFGGLDVGSDNASKDSQDLHPGLLEDSEIGMEGEHQVETNGRNGDQSLNNESAVSEDVSAYFSKDGIQSRADDSYAVYSAEQEDVEEAHSGIYCLRFAEDDQKDYEDAKDISSKAGNEEHDEGDFSYDELHSQEHEGSSSIEDLLKDVLANPPEGYQQELYEADEVEDWLSSDAVPEMMERDSLNYNSANHNLHELLGDDSSHGNEDSDDGIQGIDHADYALQDGHRASSDNRLVPEIQEGPSDLDQESREDSFASRGESSQELSIVLASSPAALVDQDVGAIDSQPSIHEETVGHDQGSQEEEMEFSHEDSEEMADIEDNFEDAATDKAETSVDERSSSIQGIPPEGKTFQDINESDAHGDLEGDSVVGNDADIDRAAFEARLHDSNGSQDFMEEFAIEEDPYNFNDPDWDGSMSDVPSIDEYSQDDESQNQKHTQNRGDGSD